MTAIPSLQRSAPSSAAGATGAAPGSEDRFLKLLVTQMQNQDPLNPLDNAQVTSQMAQINTVSGIEKLHRSVEGLNAQFAQLQVLQGVSLVGREVTVEGDRLAAGDDGRARAGFMLGAAADSVRVEVLNGAGIVIDSLELGAQGAGRHDFEWTPRAGVDAAQGQRFRVVAKSGTAALAATPLMRDRVEAVALDGDALTLELRQQGRQPWRAIKAFS